MGSALLSSQPRERIQHSLNVEKMTGYLALTLLVIVMATLPDNSQLLSLKDAPSYQTVMATLPDNSQLLSLKDAPNYQTARVDQEVNPETLSNLPSKKSVGKLEESALSRGSCSSKVLVHYSTKNDAYTQRNYIYGYYKLEQGLINGKQHYSSMFANGIYSIWYNNNWLIGSTSQKGTTYAYAYNRNNYNCPYDPAYDWFYLDYYRNWRSAGRGLSIWNAVVDLNGDGKLDLLEASPYLFESGKITGGDHQTNKQIAHRPEWFTTISKTYADLNADRRLDLLEASLRLFKSENEQ